MPESETATRRRRRPRGSISADEIVRGAYEIAREVSLDQLSMSTLSERLGVGVTSIYWYFRKKEDLLHAMTEVAAANLAERMPQFARSVPWPTMLHDYFTAYRRIHQEDEVLSDLLLARVSTYSRQTTTQVFLPVEAIVEHLTDAGFSPELALQIFNTISTYTRGAIVYKRILGLNAAAILDERRHRMADWTVMPLLEGLVAAGHSLTGTTDDDFEFALSCLISGFEQILARNASA